MYSTFRFPEKYGNKTSKPCSSEIITTQALGEAQADHGARPAGPPGPALLPVSWAGIRQGPQERGSCLPHSCSTDGVLQKTGRVHREVRTDSLFEVF